MCAHKARNTLQKAGYLIPKTRHAACLIFALITISGSASAELGSPYRINADLIATGNITSFAISPDQNWVLYRASQEVVSKYELYRAPIQGGAVVKLSHDLPSVADDVISFGGSPNTDRVVYSATNNATNTILSSVPISGGSPSTLVNTSATIWRYQISPDGSRVVYIADQDTPGVFEIYSVPIDGSTAPLRINTAFSVGRGLSPSRTFQFSPDGSRVIYRADVDTDDVYEIYSVSSNGGLVIKLHADLSAGMNTERFEISGDSSRVIIQVDTVSDGTPRYDLYSAPIATANAATKLNGSLLGLKSVQRFEISADSSRVIYVAQQETRNEDNFYSAPIAGEAAATLIADSSEKTNRNKVFQMRLTPDGKNIVYVAKPNTQVPPDRLFTLPMMGGASSQLIPDFGSGQGFTPNGISLSPDGQRVLYAADQTVDEQFELYSVPVTGGSVVTLSGTMTNNGDVNENYRASPDSSYLVYRADQETDEVFELFRSSLDGSTRSKLNTELVENSDVGLSAFQVSPIDGTWVVYRAQHTGDVTAQLYAVQLKATGNEGDYFCVPIKTAAGAISTICL